MSDQNGKQNIAEYGSWSSPITSKMAVEDGGLPFPVLSEIHTCVNGNNEGELDIYLKFTKIKLQYETTILLVLIFI
jgi:hypothetical protein